MFIEKTEQLSDQRRDALRQNCLDSEGLFRDFCVSSTPMELG